MKIFVAHASAFDYKKKLYEPLRDSALNAEHEILLPEEAGETWNTKEVIESADAFLLDASLPSTGAGIEAGWAHAAGVPIVVIHEKGSVPSSVVSYIAASEFVYDDADDLIAKLSGTLSGL